MSDVQRWSVTYTKHIKQKRKVYQDGFVELHPSSHKVMLYDDCQKILESRFVKKDEVVDSGETITFGSYLVDIGDPNEDHKPVINLDFQVKDKKIDGNSQSFHGRSFRSSFVSSEFKKSEMSKYSASPSCPDATKSKTTEWQVLYTKHLTQKAKKFHDGFLQLALCGSKGRQVMLFDASRQLIDSRVLKRDEVIKSGDALAFDGHIVDIGECEGGNEKTDLNFLGRNCNVVGKMEMRTNVAHICTESPGEWDVMYTTQITQKAKKYNCGILRVATSGSYQMLATLVSEDGNILGHKFLRLSEDVKTGKTMPVPNYLVEVGEPRISSKGDQQNSASLREIVDLDSERSTIDNVKFGRKIQIDKAAENEKCQDNAATRKNTSNTRSSGVEINVPSSRPSSTPIRAACEILSFIKKPITREEIVLVERQSKKPCPSAEAPDSVHSDVKRPDGEPIQSFDHKRDAVMHLDKGITTKDGSAISQPKVDEEFINGGILNLEDSQNGAECQATSSKFSL